MVNQKKMEREKNVRGRKKKLGEQRNGIVDIHHHLVTNLIASSLIVLSARTVTLAGRFRPVADSWRVKKGLIGCLETGFELIRTSRTNILSNRIMLFLFFLSEYFIQSRSLPKKRQHHCTSTKSDTYLRK